jgi:SAM-dependent methyltransferase
MSQTIIKTVGDYYSEKVETHGATAKGVDWNSTESQELRFSQLLKVVTDPTLPFSILDYGCGYGALFNYLDKLNWQYDYLGYDISESMLKQARAELAGNSRVDFTSSKESITINDFVIASGIFNVRLNHTQDEWKKYILQEIDFMAKLSRKGFSFNCLTKYSDAEYMRKDLHYADPLELFDLCKRSYSKNVALLHDYNLYEFTIIVRL